VCSDGEQMNESLDVLLDRYVAAQLVGDSREALRLVLDDGVGAGIPFSDLYLKLLQAAQYRIGALWQTNQISVAHEHVATGITQLVLAHLYPLLPHAPLVGRRVLVAGIDGELHELGGRMVADFFEMDGFATRYLGAGLSTEQLLTVVREDPPDVLVLSVTMSQHIDSLHQTALRVREAVGDHLALAVGGQAFTWNPSAVTAVGADIYGRDAHESVTEARRLLLPSVA
jgi:methanogenic corrinoid protein MtbC1